MSPAAPPFACPRCGASVVADEHGSWLCAVHGRVGATSLGIADFLAGRARLPAAAGGSFDLESDATLAARLAEAAGRLGYAELNRLAASAAGAAEAESAPAHRGAQERFARLYGSMEAEVGMEAGEGSVTKVNAYLEEAGQPPLGGGCALEGGSGPGLHLPGFARHFDEVVVLDCSLAFLVLARKLAEELGIAGASFVRGDLTELPLRAGSFDFVHENGVVEHVEDPARMVAEALRVTRPGGTYMCLSPNRYPLTPEAHFRLPLFGLVPPALRRHLIPRVRGLTSEAGTDLRSLRQLRRYFAEAGEPRPGIFFVPRRLRHTVRQTGIRRAVRAAYALPGVGALASALLNVVLLPVMPYHVAVVRRDDRGGGSPLTTPPGAGTPRA